MYFLFFFCAYKAPSLEHNKARMHKHPRVLKRIRNQTQMSLLTSAEVTTGTTTGCPGLPRVPTSEKEIYISGYGVENPI